MFLELLHVGVGAVTMVISSLTVDRAQRARALTCVVSSCLRLYMLLYELVCALICSSMQKKTQASQKTKHVLIFDSRCLSEMKVIRPMFITTKILLLLDRLAKAVFQELL